MGRQRGEKREGEKGKATLKGGADLQEIRKLERELRTFPYT